jgi:hypothetical protein
MGDIYRLAKTVVIFHGWPSETTREGSLITALFQFLTRSDHNGISSTESAQTNDKVTTHSGAVVLTKLWSAKVS